MALTTFTCVRPGSSAGAAQWEQEVEKFIRAQLALWAFDPYAQDGDPRLLLMLTSASGELVGVAAHERVVLHDPASGETIAASKIEVVAVTSGWQGRRFPGEGTEPGPRASDVLMSAVMTDIAGRVPPRDARVMAVVHQDNERSLVLCRRHGLIDELTRPHPAYRRLVTASNSSGTSA
ncbi:MAG: hypothetical protein QG671_2086 [Actinomycetota bacterium]|nr:hypothetical protein [Actinomycetota bacterium]